MAARGPMRLLRSVLARIDRAQQRSAVLAIPVAVVRKFGDDRGDRHAALVAYYTFFAVFPLLLALVTILGFALEDDPDLQRRVLDSALARFPIIGDQIEGNIRALTGSVVALSVGLAGALWSGLGVLGAVRDGMNELWNVERRQQASFLRARVRGFLVLLVIGLSLFASAFLAGLGTSSGGGIGLVVRGLSLAATVAMNVAVFMGVFRWLCDADLRWSTVLPGAVAAAIAWAALLAFGTWLVDRQIRDASEVYGFFAVVIGLLGWAFLGARVMLLAAELNTVLARRLWPRSLLTRDEPADRRVLAGEVHEEAAHPDERIAVRFEDDDDTRRV